MEDGGWISPLRCSNGLQMRNPGRTRGNFSPGLLPISLKRPGSRCPPWFGIGCDDVDIDDAIDGKGRGQEIAWAVGLARNSRRNRRIIRFSREPGEAPDHFQPGSHLVIQYKRLLKWRIDLLRKIIFQGFLPAFRRWRHQHLSTRFLPFALALYNALSADVTSVSAHSG